MNVLDIIRDADERTRVSFLSPDKRAESICDVGELREAIVELAKKIDKEVEE